MHFHMVLSNLFRINSLFNDMRIQEDQVLLLASYEIESFFGLATDDSHV